MRLIMQALNCLTLHNGVTLYELQTFFGCKQLIQV